ncbi:CX domain-containing protein [Caenorhabditis elegans]|uniref:CX domain-containing protein n=1 Tax=Caenorhabditis elegans TaxID=6239 RepID=A0A1I6CMA6_CAEEL|nr:CX domain-containing protein [Caenorhabditis elegans]SFQ94302.1 CX domain-containing protein [Caenorhabditis elegans]|eukprot:NP_001334231.1 Uncharacterized protein CELE_F10D2.16 [Caenorhabditis elegans]
MENVHTISHNSLLTIKECLIESFMTLLSLKSMRIHIFFAISQNVLFGGTSGFDVGLISRYVPNTFTETEPFSPTAQNGARTMDSAHIFLTELLGFGNFTSSERGFFVVEYQKYPVIINQAEYYWGASFHPPLKNGTYGCKIPLKWLVEASHTMGKFQYRTHHSKQKKEVSIEKFLKMIRFHNNAEPSEIAWSCMSPISRCCGIGCCPKTSKSQSESIFHSVFGYMCGGFMFLCCLVLLLSLVMFLCNDVWHRYIPWFPSSPRPTATPRSETHEMQELNPSTHRSPSRLHLAV